MLLLGHGEAKMLVMFRVVQRLGENICHRRKQRIEAAEELSI